MGSIAAIPDPTPFHHWLKQNSSLLQPPVNNFCLHAGNDMILMVVGGPNARNDFHVNETEEWFYQIKGSMLLRIVENDEFRDLHIHEGDTFLLPGNTPHSPIRFADTVGMVMERSRPKDSVDRLRWYCSKGGHKRPTLIREEVFHCTDLGTQLKPLIERWQQDEEGRRCLECGEIEDAQLILNN
ncbi:3-hydroxyanthranilate 3,4-dioxygenase 2 [Cercospora beticola]|uniref:3-hydroxyanthranilate 3,4-dioxygenase n=1 Tax=Cercospora beticola TaxID=122368 RepID=A0A2G5H7P6_CERBT|nr:3-hydroxyanthranilate 3,4-dioxygenase 2 [Cercospora beticola]PIA88555.1 3-hydroxyanthranilate 3,4-dioxygenase 2 [Cercospora beticola]WPB03801.1 3-hydroxyanthranilate 3,4-dioxygenase 2 [Cercospora beticola]CAK1357432.1 unnamed protein product [Cercospora beticola]